MPDNSLKETVKNHQLGIVSMLTGSGAAVKLLSTGDSTGLLAWFWAAIFTPSLALFLGVWSRNRKLFEVSYITLWYFGPLNKVPILNFTGANGSGNIEFYIPLSLLLIALAFIGKAWQLRN